MKNKGEKKIGEILIEQQREGREYIKRVKGTYFEVTRQDLPP